MPKPNIRKPFQRAYRFLRRRVYAAYHRLDRHTDEAFSEEPIDFSAPSVPYYENLASRLSFARIVLYMALLVFVIVTVISNHRLITYDNLSYLVREIDASTRTAQSEAERLSYPISSSTADFAEYRGGLVVAGSETVTVMSGSGRKTLSVNVDYADPEVRASDKYFLTFDRGEPSFSVYNTFAEVHKQFTDFPIYDASVADDGSFAVLTRSRTYTSEVMVYDEDMSPIFVLRRNGYVTGMAMAPDGKTLGVVSFEDVGGLAVTKITLVRIGNRITEESVTLTNSIGTVCGFTTSDRFAVVLSDRLLVFKPDATITSEVKINDKSPLLVSISDNRIALLTRSRADLSTEYLATYDYNGRLLTEIPLDAHHPVREIGGADELAIGGDTLYVRAGNTLFRLDSNRLTIRSTESISHDTVCILPADGKAALICTTAYADRLSE